MTGIATPITQTQHRPLRRWLWIALAIPLIPLTLVLVLLIGLFVIASTNIDIAAAAPVQAQTTQFDGRYLIAASDADMIGTAYADSVLRQIPGDVDTLSVIELPLTNSAARVFEIPVSNSVTSWPQITAVSPDGNMIYVAETAGQVEDSVTQLASNNFPVGRGVTVIDISDGVANATTTLIDVADYAVHLALNADGTYLAVGTRERGRQVAILPTDTLDTPETFRYFSIEGSSGQPADQVTSVFWHPSGEFLAVGINAQEIAFYRVNRDDEGGLSIEPHGERITGGYALTYGQFTSDGRYYLTSEINWERYPAPLESLINPPSEMLSIRFDTTDAAQHRIVSRVPVGQSAEGFAINRQEDLVVTVNMERTYLMDTLAFWPGGQMNSLSVLTFNRETGELALVGEHYGFEGVLPEHAMFDADGDSLGVLVYNERENPMNLGYIEFWNVVGDGEETRLERTAVRLPVVRGPHAMNFIP